MLSLNGIHTDVNICCFRDRRLSWGIRCCYLRQFCVDWSWKVSVCFTSISINVYCNEIHVTIIFKTNKSSVKHVYVIYSYTFLTHVKCTIIHRVLNRNKPVLFVIEMYSIKLLKYVYSINDTSLVIIKVPYI